MMPKRGPSAYDILGVSPSVTQGEIRRAYFVKARALHPDRHAVIGHDQMAQLNNAMDMLDTPEKRALYDNRDLVNWGGVDADNFAHSGGLDLLRHYFGNTVDIESSSVKSLETRVHVHCPPGVLAQGATVDIPYTRQTLDQVAYSAAMARKLACGTCSGRGYIMVSSGLGNESRRCHECREPGASSAFIREERNIMTVKIPPGAPERYEYVAEYLGGQVENREPGDAVFVFYADGHHPPKSGVCAQTFQLFGKPETVETADRRDGRVGSTYS